MNDDALDFLQDEAVETNLSVGLQPWKVLIVDDEPEIHSVTRFALSGVTFQEREIELISAHSAEEAKKLLLSENDFAMALLDVVMETNHAGLHLAKWIREELENHAVRIILRTGQPGEAPEKSIITQYDINGYKEKAELTSKKLFTLTCSSLRSYQDIQKLEANKAGLRMVIEASGTIFKSHSFEHFCQNAVKHTYPFFNNVHEILEQELGGLIVKRMGEKWVIVNTSEKYNILIGLPLEEVESLKNVSIGPDEAQYIELSETSMCLILRVRPNEYVLLPIENLSDHTPEDPILFELYLHNISIALENIYLLNQTEATQREIAYRLGEAVETRSKETGGHVKRVAEMSRYLALGYGMSEKEADLIKIASPLHDVGKIGISDKVLNKPGKLTDEEWKEMQTHAEMGKEILTGSDLKIITLASSIAGSHHERWDGKGYPKNLKEDEIPLEARITAVADVFDALASDRCYKKAWPLDKIVSLFKEERGKQFEPKIVDVLLSGIDDIIAIRDQYKDN